MAESINFPSYRKWKQIVNSRTFKHERAYFLTVSEEKPVVKLTLTAFANYSPSNFWSPTWNNPDLVPKIRTQIRLLVNVGLTLFRPGFFYRLKVSGTIKASPMKLCTIIVLLKAYQNTKRNYQNMTYDVTMTSLLKTMAKFGPPRNQTNYISLERK